MTTSEPESTIERHFVELATRTLEGLPEIRDEARGELLGRLVHSGATEDEVENALCRLAKVVPTGSAWKGFLAGGFMLLALASVLFLQVRSSWPELKLLPAPTGYSTDLWPWIAHLSDHDRELFRVELSSRSLAGNSLSSNEVLESTDRLRLRYPDDPALHELHALHYIIEHSDVPPGYRETWQRIDPNNGIWNVWEAAAVTWGDSKIRPEEQLEHELETATHLLEQAVAAPNFSSHIPELRRTQVAVIPDFPATFWGESARLRLMTLPHRFHSAFSLEASALSAFYYLKAEQAVKERDEAGFAHLISLWRTHASRSFMDTGSWRGTDSKLFVVAIGKTLADAAGKLGMAAQQEEVQRLLDRVAAAVPGGSAAGNFGKLPALDVRPLSTPARHDAERVMLHFEPEAYRPGRLAEYFGTERIFSLGAALLGLLVLAAVVLESFRRNRRVNGLADGLSPLCRGTDMAWTVGLGCGVPLLWYGLITQLTPFGCRDIGMTFFQPIPPLAIQLVATLLLAGVMMLQAGQWRLKAQLGFLGLGKKGHLAGWIVAAITALIVPLAGSARWLSGGEKEFLHGIAAACGIPLLWLVWQAGAIVFSPAASALGGVLLSRRLITPLAVGCLMLLGLQPLLLSSEQSWLAKDTVTRIDRSRGGIPVGEADAVERLAKTLSALFAEAE